MKKSTFQLVTIPGAIALVAASVLIGGSAAQANTGTCGYYSESRADNSNYVCVAKQVQSVVYTPGAVHYGGWATYGYTSWQNANYPVVTGFTYNIR